MEIKLRDPKSRGVFLLKNTVTIIVIQVGIKSALGSDANVCSCLFYMGAEVILKGVSFSFIFCFFLQFNEHAHAHVLIAAPVGSLFTDTTAKNKIPANSADKTYPRIDGSRSTGHIAGTEYGPTVSPNFLGPG